MENKCPRCAGEVKDKVLYKCVRCFTVYCKECPDTRGGGLCPRCGMAARIVLDQDK